jgi:hypothetical protein
MQDIITVGKRLIPLEQIAFVEPFDPARSTEFRTEKSFKSRVVLLNRDTALAECDPLEFATTYSLRWLSDDQIAINRKIAFRVETFTPTDTFKPTKAYKTRLKWDDLDGNEQSKLLVTDPETVIRVVLRGIEVTDPPRPEEAPSANPRKARLVPVRS